MQIPYLILNPRLKTPKSCSHPFQTISGETTQCIKCIALPSDLPEGPIVLGFVGTLIDMNLGNMAQVLERSLSTKNQQSQSLYTKLGFRRLGGLLTRGSNGVFRWRMPRSIHE
jgi:hypothetical protein